MKNRIRNQTTNNNFILHVPWPPLVPDKASVIWRIWRYLTAYIGIYMEEIHGARSKVQQRAVQKSEGNL